MGIISVAEAYGCGIDRASQISKGNLMGAVIFCSIPFVYRSPATVILPEPVWDMFSVEQQIICRAVQVKQSRVIQHDGPKSR
eukprot:scaffold265641_cov36-Prasinocladus_malaysianus.AAC.2